MEFWGQKTDFVPLVACPILVMGTLPICPFLLNDVTWVICSHLKLGVYAILLASEIRDGVTMKCDAWCGLQLLVRAVRLSREGQVPVTPGVWSLVPLLSPFLLPPHKPVVHDFQMLSPCQQSSNLHLKTSLLSSRSPFLLPVGHPYVRVS